MTQNTPLVPPGADPVPAEDAQRPDAAQPQETLASEVPGVPSPPPEPAGDAPAQPSQGIGFDGAPGTAPIHTAAGESRMSGRFKTAATAAPSSGPPPDEPAPEPCKPGPAENSFRAMSYLAFLFLGILLLMQMAASFYWPPLYLPQETLVARVAAGTKHFGLWLTPAMGGQPALFPGYFWFLGAVNLLWQAAERLFPVLQTLPVEHVVFSATAWLAAFVVLAGTYFLGRVTGLGRQAAFAGALLLLSSLGFVPFSRVIGPDMLFAGVLTFALAFLYRGWVSNFSFFSLILGFMLTGCCVLLGGLPGLLIPVIVSLVFLLWRGTPRRGQRLDAILGFVLMLAILLGWMGSVILFTEESAYMQSLRQQILAPFLPPYWPPQDPWWLPTALLCAALAPWLLVVFFVSWGRVLLGSWTALKASRGDRAGMAWLWLSLVVGLLLCTALPAKPWLMVAPLLPLAALLLGKALVRLTPGQSRLFFLLVAMLFFLLGLVLAVGNVPAVTTALLPVVPPFLRDGYAIFLSAAGQPLLPVLAGICIVGAAVLIKLTNRSHPGGALAVTALLVIVLAQPLGIVLTPSLDAKLAETVKTQRGISAPPPPAVAAPQADPAPPAVDAPTPAAPPENALPTEPATPEAATPAPAPAGEQAAPAVPEAASPVEPAPAAPATPPAAPQPEAEAPAVPPAAPAPAAPEGR